MDKIGFLGFGVVLATGKTLSYISQFTDITLVGVKRKLFEEWSVVEKDIGAQPEVRLKLESFPMIYFCENARNMTNQASCLFKLSTMMVFFNLAINVQSVTTFESQLFYSNIDSIAQSKSALLQQPEFGKSVREIIDCRDSGKEYKPPVVEDSQSSDLLNEYKPRAKKQSAGSDSDSAKEYKPPVQAAEDRR